MSVKEKVLDILRANNWITVAYLRSFFDPHEKGAQSVDRYIRFLRADGYNIIKKRRNRSSSCWEYKLVKKAVQGELFSLYNKL